jgi:hypothetical protein
MTDEFGSFNVNNLFFQFVIVLCSIVFVVVLYGVCWFFVLVRYFVDLN